MPTYRLDLAYIGADFHGYARQPGLRTIQGEVENVLAPYTGGAPTVVAGRTDRGVHAAQQVVSFSCDEIDTARVVRSLNGQLAPQIAALSLAEVPDDFSARFSATGRAYRYRIKNADVHDPLIAATTWTYEKPLDVDAMNHAIAPLVGRHDFVAFCRKQDGLSTEREVFWIRWRRDGDMVELSIGANSFCHQMVRSIVGASVEVGGGRISPDSVQAILASSERHRSAGAVPAHGLVLVAIAYDYEPLARPSWVPEAS